MRVGMAIADRHSLSTENTGAPPFGGVLVSACIESEETVGEVTGLV